MLKDKLQIYTLSIVFIGDFNPVIIQPFWLAHKKLIRDQEAEDAKDVLVHNELVKFDLGWAYLEITKNRFEIRTSKEPYFEVVKDLALSIFKVLKDTPIKVLGINHIKHFILTDEELYNFGDKLAPLSNWNEFLSDPKMLFLEIIEQKRKDGLKGHIRIKVHPSDQVGKGVVINLNDNFSLREDQNGRNGEIVNILQENWNNSQVLAEEISESIWKKIK